MPELPEVETTRRHLADAVEGRKIDGVELRRDRIGRRNLRPADVPERLSGRVVRSVGRRGKFIISEVEGDLTWVIHLGMSGRVRIVDPAEPEDPHTHFVAGVEGGLEVRLVDPRTFGFVAVLTPEEFGSSTVAGLGPDALDQLPRAEELAKILGNRTAPVKALLLDQRILAGLGNIYADEVLARAGIRPTRPGGSLTTPEVAALRKAIRPVLEAGIRHGGTSLGDLAYLLPDGRAGEYLSRLWVYGREGEPCRRCKAPIVRRVVAQRSSYFCLECQR